MVSTLPQGAAPSNQVGARWGAASVAMLCHALHQCAALQCHGCGPSAPQRWRAFAHGSSSHLGAGPARLLLPPQAAAELAITADGRFLYNSNRGFGVGLNNVAIFAVAPGDGALSPLGWEDGGGVVSVPRHISLAAGDSLLLVRGVTCRWRRLGACWHLIPSMPALSPSYRCTDLPRQVTPARKQVVVKERLSIPTDRLSALQVANQGKDTVTSFRRDPSTGLLDTLPTQSAAGVVSQPSFVGVVPSGGIGGSPGKCR